MNEEAPTYGMRLGRGILWSLVGMAVPKVAGLASSVWIARHVGREVFGELGMLQSTVGMAGMLAGLGLGGAAGRYVAVCRGRGGEGVGDLIAFLSWITLLSGAVWASGVLLLRSVLAAGLLSREDLSSVLGLCAGLVLLNTLNGVAMGILTGLEEWKLFTGAQALAGLAVPGVSVLMTMAWGRIGLIASLLASGAISTATGAWAVRCALRSAGVRVGWAMHWGTHAPVLTRFALPGLMGGLLVTPVLWSCSVVLARTEGGYGELGVFTAANQWRGVIYTIPGVVGGALLPVLSEAFGAGKKRDFEKATALGVRVTGSIALPIVVAVILWSRAIHGLLGREYAGEESVTAVLCASAFAIVTFNTVGTALSAMGLQWLGFWLNVVWAGVMSGSTLLLVPSLGAAGLAWANVISYGVHGCVVLLMTERRGLGGLWRDTRFVFLAGASSTGIALAAVCQGGGSVLLAQVAAIVIACMPAAREVAQWTGLRARLAREAGGTQ